MVKVIKICIFKTLTIGKNCQNMYFAGLFNKFFLEINFQK